MPTGSATLSKPGHPALHTGAQIAQRTGQIRQAPLPATQPHRIRFGRLKDWRRVATRYDRCPIAFFSAIALDATVIFWL
jgi:hypothetical protein